MNDVILYDTTLRDGCQRYGLSLTVDEKLDLAQRLDAFGVPYIEGGWPGSNPKDAAFFKRSRHLSYQQARLVAFGSTRRAHMRVENDGNLNALLDAETQVVALVGKACPWHVKRVLRTEREENLRMIGESIAWMKRQGRDVVFDAEHFFDGCRRDADYALRVLQTANDSGADWLVLCDTNGGTMPDTVAEITRNVSQRFPGRLGVHAHNDCELAVANSLVALAAGATMVQGTINGYGERCGNANLVSLIANLQLKLGRRCVPSEKLKDLRALAHDVSEMANLAPDPHAAYVGDAAFAHKGGIHVAAVERDSHSYEHVAPDSVGNQRAIAISELSGKCNIRMGLASLALNLGGKEQALLEQVKAMEHRGYHFEGAEASLALLGLRLGDDYQAPFVLRHSVVISDSTGPEEERSQATVKVRIGEREQMAAAEGVGPVHALDQALRGALSDAFPQLKQVRLSDYKVRILDQQRATKAVTRVLIEASAHGTRWHTVGCSANIIEASSQALTECYEYFLWKQGLTVAVCPVRQETTSFQDHYLG